MKRLSFFVTAVLPFAISFSQIAYPVSSSVSVANTSVSNMENRTPFHNPASFAVSPVSLLVCAFENRYIITELATKSFLALFPFKHFATGFAFAHQGFASYHEIILGAAFARNFSGKFSLGVQFNYHTVWFALSNNYRGIIYPQIGLMIPFDNNFLVGFHVFNPFASNIRGESLTKFVPSVFSLGCSYGFASNFHWRFQADKELRSNYRFATGFDYRMKKHTRFQLGVSVNEFLISCLGFGFDFNPFIFDLITELHPLLGLNIIAQIQFRLSKK